MPCRSQRSAANASCALSTAAALRGARVAMARGAVQHGGRPLGRGRSILISQALLVLSLMATIAATGRYEFTHQSDGAWLVTGSLMVMKPADGDTVRFAVVCAAATVVVGAAAAGAMAAATSRPWVLLGGLRHHR